MTKITNVTMIALKTNVVLNIFDEPCIKERISELFTIMENDIKERYDEIIEFLDLKGCTELSFDKVFSLFKVYFYKSLSIEAVEEAFDKPENSDIITNIKSLLSESKLKVAIMGQPMINAFKKAISLIPYGGTPTSCINGGKILLLEKNFCGKKIFNNHCSSCYCSCTCDGSCNGNPRRCTSDEAIERNCTHCCGCILKFSKP